MAESKRVLRRTEQRSLILEELRACARQGLHPGADELYARVRTRLPRISLATVYRNLEVLAGSGLIKRLGMGARHRRFDGAAEPHCHFRCTRCGRVEDLPFDAPVPPLNPRHPWVRARVIHGGQAEYDGLCPSCTGRTGRAGRLARRAGASKKKPPGVSRPEIPSIRRGASA